MKTLALEIRMNMFTKFLPFNALCTLTIAVAHCSSPLAAPQAEVVTTTDEGPSVSIERTEIVSGVPAKGREPAVVALQIDNRALCTGVLIAKDVVLTARHCVARTAESIACPAIGPQIFESVAPENIEVLLGDAVVGQPASTRAKEIVAPTGVTLCNGDIALIILENPIANSKPVGVGSTGVRTGDFVRAVGFGKRGSDGPAGQKYIREHVPILGSTAEEFQVGEATCQGDSGGPAFDEDTGQVVGVISRGGPSCEGPEVHNIYTRVDAFAWLVDLALSKSGKPKTPSAQPPGAPRAGSKKPMSDVGTGCAEPQDCAAGICIHAVSTAYCSRRCGSGDRCPSGFHCKKVEDASYCIRAR
jgi:V8-like Glu-specific endopeptidase